MNISLKDAFELLSHLDKDIKILLSRGNYTRSMVQWFWSDDIYNERAIEFINLFGDTDISDVTYNRFTNKINIYVNELTA